MSKFTKFFKLETLTNNKGASLIETLSAAAIMLVIALAMATVTHSFSKQNASLQSKLDSIEAEQAIIRLLSDSASCSCMFKDLSVPSGASMELENVTNGCLSSGEALLTKNKTLFSSTNLVIKSISLNRFKNLSLDSASADLEIAFEPNTNIVMPKGITVTGLSFAINNGKVSHCLGDKDANQLCSLIGGTMSQGKCRLPTVASSSPVPEESPGPISINSSRGSVATGQLFDICWSASWADVCRGQAGQAIGNSGCKSGSHVSPGTYSYSVTCSDSRGRSSTATTAVVVTGGSASGSCSADAGNTCIIPSTGKLGTIRCDGTCTQ